jgi:hypothetical protein
VLVKLLVRLLLPALHCQPVSDHTRARKHPAITSRLPITVTLRIHSGPGIRTLWGKEHHIEPPRVQFRDVETKCLCRCAVLKPALPLLLELTLLLYQTQTLQAFSSQTKLQSSRGATSILHPFVPSPQWSLRALTRPPSTLRVSSTF